MAIRLAYPTIAAPSCQVVLPDVEQLPASRPVRMRQTVLETDSGAAVVYTIGPPSVTVFTVTLYPLSATQADAIKSFFSSSSPAAGVNGRANAWQFQDSRGAIMTVRFVQDVLEPLQRSPNSWSVALTLRQEPG
ncbi:MAG: hypothetical protein HQM00_01810 [Magnetococcales bacterium]|nr:hypothetical protein [Magnetococcales bacterium]